MRPAALRALILIATMTLVAFGLTRVAVMPPPPASAAAPPRSAKQVLPLPAAGIDPAVAQPSVSGALPALADFAAQRSTGDSRTVTGVYIPGLLAFRVVQQPADDIYFIDPAGDAATQYQLAAAGGTVGLLAHNYSGGSAFALIPPGETVWLTFGDGSTRAYRVEGFRRYQALEPDDPYGSLIDLDTGAELDSSTVFGIHYTGDRLVFQTCIEQDGDWSWGRLFIIAAPVEE